MMKKFLKRAPGYLRSTRAVAVGLSLAFAVPVFADTAPEERGWAAVAYGYGDDSNESWGAAWGMRTEKEAKQSAKIACFEESRKLGITGSCYNGDVGENKCLVVVENSRQERYEWNWSFANTREETIRELREFHESENICFGCEEVLSTCD